MDIETTKKFLAFITIECDRHLRDGNVSDDELNQLFIELQRFQNKVENSSIPPGLKAEILDLEFNYDSKNVRRGALLIIITIFTFGAWGFILEMRQQSKRIQTLEDLKQSTSSLGFKINMGL